MQLKLWTDGTLYQSEQRAADPERFYPSVSTDTRSLVPGEVFVPLVGEHFDGHYFLETAAAKGAGMLVIERKAGALETWLDKVRSAEEVPDILVVEDTGKA